jgi:pimeloyl-ACP methyl ester carboxylesterase
VRAPVARRLTHDGVGLAFEDAGSGGPPLLLVHGWACNRSYLRPQLEHFSRERRVVAVDLRGHGASDAPVQQYSMATFADDLVWLCSQLDIVQPVIVGHSMGGVVALETVARYPEFAAGVVALDAPLVLPPTRLAQLRAVGEGFSSSDFVNAVRRFVEGMFLPTDDPSHRSRIVEAMSGGPEFVLRSSWTELFDCPSASAATATPIPVPVLAIASAGGHMADLNRLAELSSLLVIGQTVGAGHFHQLVVPDQVNAMIDRFLTVAQIGSYIERNI